MTDDDIRIGELEARVARLESQIEELRGSEPSGPPPPPPPSQGAPPLAASMPTPPPPPSDITPGVQLDSELLLKWGGVGLVVLAVGFAVSTAISRGWIGPELQLAGAVGFSLALIGTGLRLRPDRMPWAKALCVGGVAALFTTFASDLFIDSINETVAYVATAVVAAGGFALARFVPSQWVATVTLLGATIGWLVIGEGEPPWTASLIGVTVMTALALAIALEREWHVLRLATHGIALISLLALAATADTGPERVAVAAVVASLFVSMARLPSIGDLSAVAQKLEVQMAMVLAPWLFLATVWLADVDDDAPAGWLAIAAAVVAAAAALALRSQIQPAHFVSLAVSASVALSIGFAVLLGAEGGFLAVAVQGAGLVLLSRQLNDNLRVLLNAGLLLVIGATYALDRGFDAWNEDMAFGSDLIRLFTIVAIAVGVAVTGNRRVHRFGGLVVLGLFLQWLGTVLGHLPEGQAIVSVSWAAVGIAVLVVGAMRKISDLGTVGLGVLAITVAKLLVIDMNEVDTLWRAGLFMLVGLGLMRLGFLLPRLTGTDHPPAQ